MSLYGGKLGRILSQQILLSRLAKSDQLELFHAPAYTLPLFLKIPTVLTVYDVIALSHPAYCTLKNRLHFGLLLRASAHRASLIIAPTKKIKQDIVQWLNVPSSRVKVVELGCSPSFYQLSSKENSWPILQRRFPKLSKQFIFFAGNIEPKKNLFTLLKAFAHLHQYKPDLQLVITGQKKGGGWQLKSYIDALNIRASIIQLGYLSEYELNLLYNLAQVFVFPSLYEGFGLPNIEAMRCGTPVLTTKMGGIPEVVQDGALMFEPPTDDKALADILYQLLNNKTLRQELVERGLKIASQYSWDKVAKKLLDCYDAIPNYLAQ